VTTAAEHPTPAQEQLLREVASLHLKPEELAETLRVTAQAVQHIAPAPGATVLATAGSLALGSIQSDLINSVTKSIQASIRSLGTAMSSTPGTVSPQLARSLQAAENIWRRMENEFGLLTSMEVAELLGSRKPNRTAASALRNDGSIIGIMRGNSYRFPGFQFDAKQGTVLPVMPRLIALARENGRSDDDVVFWLTSPSSFFAEQDRPVDHMREDERLLAAARDQFEGSW